MKHQALFSWKVQSKKEKKSKVPSAAVVLGTLRVKERNVCLRRKMKRNKKKSVL